MNHAPNVGLHARLLAIAGTAITVLPMADNSNMLANSRALERALWARATTGSTMGSSCTSPSRFGSTLLNKLSSRAYSAPSFTTTRFHFGTQGFQEFSCEMFEGTKAGEIRSFTSLPEQKLCWIPPGTFRLGSPTTEETREDHEFQEDVMLGHGFWMAQTETTQAQWLAIMDSLPEAMIGQAPAGPSYPVTNVTWHEASKYCERLTDRERVAGRIEHDMMFLLPTEAQWEYAYRSGSTTAFYWGDSIESLDLHAWFHDNTTKVGEPHAHEVGLKQSNQWGLLDMAGNVKEWCSDLYADRRHLYDSSEFPEVLQIRNAKGGSWAFKSPQKFRAAMRDGGLPDDPSDDIGFRVILVRSYPSE